MFYDNVNLTFIFPLKTLPFISEMMFCVYVLDRNLYVSNKYDYKSMADINSFINNKDMNNRNL